jgi:2-phosphoglycerate kinase
MAETFVLRGEHGAPYSKWLMSQSLSAAGLPPERAYELARRIEARLGGEETISAAHLRELAEEVLEVEEGEAAVQRFRAWERLDHLDRPLILLLEGTAGVGKSTLATTLAGRLGLTRVIPTDVIREVLRACFSAEFMPAVHYSSFEAGMAVELPPGKGEDDDLLGFTRQAEAVLTGVSAILERAVRESVGVVIEGVHMVPGAVSGPVREQGVVVEAMIAVEDEERHRAHFPLRGGERPADRYLDRFEQIRKLQAYLTERAEAADVAVVENASIDASLATVMELVLDAVDRAAPADR